MNAVAVGVWRNDVPTLVESVKQRLSCEQHWASMPGYKFVLINQLLSRVDFSAADYLLVVDDDVSLPRENFVDDYLAQVVKHDLALAQPARAWGSTFDHPITMQSRDKRGVRVTNFVEIGPVFSIRRDLFDALLPFDERSPMGFGYDTKVWPRVIQHRRLRMGIVDATPVGHSFRPGHDYDIAKAMRDADNLGPA